MGKFDSLKETSFSKKTCYTDAEKLYAKAYSAGEKIDYKYLENLNIQDLKKHNQKKKYNENLIILWAKLEMKSFIDFQLGNTINPYFISNSTPVSIKFLPDFNYMRDEARHTRLLDLKFIKSLSLQNIKFTNVYLAIYEIMSFEDIFCPYVELYTKSEDSNDFIKFGYGYDNTKNGKVELYINSFNYPVLLNSKGIIESPLSGERKKLDVYDYIIDDDIGKLLSK